MDIETKIKITDNKGKELELSLDEARVIFNYLQNFFVKETSYIPVPYEPYDYNKFWYETPVTNTNSRGEIRIFNSGSNSNGIEWKL